MNKNFLVTISSNTDNLAGVKFVCNFFKPSSNHQLTLLHIYRRDSQDMNTQLTKMWEKPIEDVEGQLTFGAKKAIDKAKDMLSHSNISIERMVVKTVDEKFGKVRDILTEGSNGFYDAIVLGKRGAYALQWMFEKPADEIAQSIIKDTAFYNPLWVCPQTSNSRKNVLVCVDGSKSSYRAVDHVGYILQKQEQHQITLFHVRSPDGSANETEIFNKSEQLLKEHGIDQSRISIAATWGLSIGNTIIDKATRDNFAAVAIGLHGKPHGFLKDFNMAGGTTSNVIAKIEKTSVWCCP